MSFLFFADFHQNENFQHDNRLKREQTGAQRSASRKAGWLFSFACLSVSIMLFVGSESIAQEKTKEPTGIHFKNVKVFDGFQFLDSVDVLVQDKKITAIGKNLKSGQTFLQVDGKGKTLLPGLIDCHTHVFNQQDLKQACHFGVTTELDMMSAPGLFQVLKRQQAANGAYDQADFFSAGSAVTVPKGHGTQFGFVVPTVMPKDDVAAFVKARKSEGSDYLKIIYETGKAYGFSRPTLSERQVRAAIKEAGKQKILSVVHVGSLEGAKLVVGQSPDGLVHLFADESITPELVAEIKKKKLFVIPTAAVIQTICGVSTNDRLLNDKNLQKSLTQADLAQLGRKFPAGTAKFNRFGRLIRSIKMLDQAGVKILAGTDAPNPGTAHGVSLHQEIHLLVEAGLSNARALSAATGTAAKSFRLNDRGRIAKGCYADLILVNGDPEKEITATRRIVNVWKRGKKIDRSIRLAMISKEKEASKKKAKVTGPAAKPLLVSDFENGSKKVPFGAGWSISTDKLFGGKSDAEMEVVAGSGAEKTKGFLKVNGTVRLAGRGFAGVFLTPGANMNSPKDLSGFKGFSFWAKGDGKPKSAMLFTKSGGFQPSIMTFTPGKDWKQHRFNFKQFRGSNGNDVIGIFVGENGKRDFSFQIDQVMFQN